MENGDHGLPGQHVKVTARNQDPEYVTTLLQSRKESSAKVLVKSLGPAQMVNVLSMEFGEVGHHGQIVTVSQKEQKGGFPNRLTTWNHKFPLKSRNLILVQTGRCC